jgi:serine/threonine protein phosphatase PrpC
MSDNYEISQVSVASSIGARSYQEDFHVYHGFTENCLIGVMDGHDGKSVAKFCCDEIGNLFPIDIIDQPETALKILISELNKRTEKLEAGSTISLALIFQNRVTVAVLGDSPVMVLDKHGQFHISPEHNVRSNKKERRAAELRGGIYEGGYLFTKFGDRGVQLSRVLGDAYLGEVISREPEKYTVHNPIWVMVASDGILDPGHNNTSAMAKEVKILAEKNSSAKDLLAWAEKRGLEDNATAVVWRLNQI